MFWDKAAKLYDVFEYLFNRDGNQRLCEAVASLIGETDDVLECACGTGMITEAIGQKCRRLIATDFSVGMLRQAKKKCGNRSNVIFRKADITRLKFRDNTFDTVVAGNVIHLLEDPRAALKELERVCKTGGKIIIPTYINEEKKGKTGLAVKLIGKAGAGFQQQFTYGTYREFFASAGYEDVEYQLAEGRMPCAIAIIRKTERQV